MKTTHSALRDLYLELIKRCVLGLIYEDRPLRRWDAPAERSFSRQARIVGADWPSQAHSMIGLKRMENLQFCVERAIADGVKGDLMETGVWRGGACIFMRAILAAHGLKDRRVWVADSFQGLPPPDQVRYPKDEGLFLNRFAELAVAREEVQSNFERYGLLDGQVRFLQGWFRDTLPTALVERLAVLRLDGDLYESTTDALVHLYPKVSAGGFVIIDDYGVIEACRQAVDDYRKRNVLTEKMHKIDSSGVYWRRAR